DGLSAGTDQERRAAASALLTRTGPLLTRQRALLYAPTWRHGATDPAVPPAEPWVRIVRMREQPAAIPIIRSHPLGEGSYSPPWSSGRVRMLNSELLADVTPALARIDALITDYSSMAYDVGLLSMPVVYLAPDVVDYGRERGFYGRYEDVAGDDYARDWDGAIEQIDAVLADGAVRTERAERSS